MMNTILLQHGYLPVSIPPIRRHEYISALQSYNLGKGRLDGFIDFIAENHYNTLFLYLEWRVRTKTFDIGKKDGYSAEELKEKG